MVFNLAKLPEIEYKNPVYLSVFYNIFGRWCISSQLHLKNNYQNRLNPSNYLYVALSNCVPRSDRIASEKQQQKVTMFVSNEQ